MARVETLQEQGYDLVDFEQGDGVFFGVFEKNFGVLEESDNEVSVDNLLANEDHFNSLVDYQTIASPSFPLLF